MHFPADHLVCAFGQREVIVPLVYFDVVENCSVRLATRFAFPLVLGWAMTIHRPQGTILNSLAIAFSQLSWREPGLAYAGLSRCRAIEDLFVRGLRCDHSVASEDARAFCRSCEHSRT